MHAQLRTWERSVSGGSSGAAGDGSVTGPAPVVRPAERDDQPLVLLVERSREDASGVLDHLEGEAFRVRRASRGADAVAVASRCRPDVVLLQADAADDGLELMGDLLRTVAAPVIIVAASDTADSVAALDRGADDYMVEPAALSEIAARARAAIRRTQRLARPRVRQLGALELDGRTGLARAGDQRLALTPSEYLILDHLSRTPGQVVTHGDLVLASGECKANSIAALSQRVRRLRAKLAAAGIDRPSISAVHGVGYRLDR